MSVVQGNLGGVPHPITRKGFFFCNKKTRYRKIILNIYSLYRINVLTYILIALILITIKSKTEVTNDI